MWKIGFEFEFSFLEEQFIKPTNFIEKFVEDQSCYIEAITYPVSLLSNCKKRDEIFDLIKSHSYLENPKINKLCGGHITISKLNLTGKELFIKFKKYIPIIYSLCFKRLKYHACCKNLYLDKIGIKFAPMHAKKDLLEIRLFPMSKNIDEIFFRYKLINKIAEAIDKNLSYDKFLDTIKDLIDPVFINYSYHFKKMIKEKKRNKYVRNYLPR